MKRKLISIGIAVLIIVLAFGVVKLMKGNARKEREKPERKVPLVEVVKPRLGDVSFKVKATGKLQAVQRFNIVSEVNGQLSSQALQFKEGKAYRKGELMLSVNSKEYEMNLVAKKSDFITRITSVLADLKYDYPDAYQPWYDYVNSIDVEKALPQLPKPNSDKEKFYLVGKGLYSVYYNLKSMEERLSKYNIVAPYDGVLIRANVVQGEAVRSGSSLGTFINPHLFDLEVSYPLSLVKDIKKGTLADLYSSDLKQSWQGEVVRIGANIDAKTQSVKVFIRVKGSGLVEGMFLTAAVRQQAIKGALSISRKLIDNQNKVFLVKNGHLKLQKIEVLETQGDIAVVKGLTPEDELMTTVIKSAYNGMEVRVQ